MSKEGLVLDCGGGDRRISDPRYINFEYQHFELPHVYGDAHKLPFCDGVFDLVLSQAVLEHMTNPFKAVEEIYRITKPGGEVYAEMAFMQPLHAVPYHYFNGTIWGIEELFKNFKIIDISWFGNLSKTVEWFMDLAEVKKKMGTKKYSRLISQLKEVDEHITNEQLKMFASGVSLHCRRA